LTTPGNLPGAILSTEAGGIGERGLIERIRRRLPAPPPSLIVDVGDDAAVAVPDRGALQVLTTDALVEGVHFDRRFSSPADIGHKALAVNLSDIAAMGGTPRFALLSLMLPDRTTIDEVDGVLDGLLPLADAARVALAGGNITRSPGPLVIDVTVIGSVRRRRVLTRAGGRPGDLLYVTGSIGGAAAGLAWLREHGVTGLEWPAEEALASAVRRHRRPEPRVRLGALLGRNRAARACMDLSDGLADAVRQVAEASGTGARISAEKLPLDPGAALVFTARGTDPVQAAISGGDDYELLVAVQPKMRGRLRGVQQQARGVPLTCIGELTAEPDLLLDRAGVLEPLPQGFVHF
jgi:thiamine-monophosphate kinase